MPHTTFVRTKMACKELQILSNRIAGMIAWNSIDILWAVFYVLGIEYIGFYTCTLASLFIMHMNFEQWSKRVLLQAVIFSASLCVIFAVSFKYLKVFLPNTPLP